MNLALRGRRGGVNRDQQGFSLIEMVVVLSILGVVMATLFGVLDVSTRASSRNQSFLQNQENVRLVLDREGRDIRSAVQLNDLATNRNLSTRTGSYSHQYTGQTVADAPYLVEFDKADGSTWRWWLDSSSNTLYEQLWDPSSSTFTTQLVLTNARNVQTGVAMLRYYRAGDGAELSPNSASAPSDLANCAIHIHLAISSDSNPGPIPFTMESDVELRNRLPGGIPQC
jgi:prepilin-type N-terminal cleavage/methylation domain-containing protein